MTEVTREQIEQLKEVGLEIIGQLLSEAKQLEEQNRKNEDALREIQSVLTRKGGAL